MSAATPPGPSPPSSDWRARRLALHKRVAEVEGVRSLSQLAGFKAAQQTWSEPEMAAVWAQAAAESSARTVNSLYVHVPFCKSICDFCNYERLRPSSPGALTAWRDRVLASIDTFAPAVDRLEFHALYVGGGTPSVLPARILREVFTAIDSRLRWRPYSNRSIELDPAVVNADKVQAMLDHGFHRFSFGVQTTDKAVNQAHNRGPQGPAMVRRCLDLLPAGPGSSVTADVLLGLQGVSPEDTLRDLELLMAHPRRPAVDLFHLTPTTHYVDEHFAGDAEAAAAAVDRYGADFDAALAELCARQLYTVRRGGSHHCRSLHPGGLKEHLRRWLGDGLRGTWRRPSRPPDEMVRHAAKALKALPAIARRQPVYSQIVTEVREPFNLMGLGPSARTQVFGQAAVQTRPHAGEEGPTTYVGSPVDHTDELVNFVLFEVRDRGRVLDEDLLRVCGTTLAESRPDAVAEWQRMGLVQRIEGGWQFQRERRAIAEDMLWVVPESHLEALVARKTRRDHAG